MCGCASLDSPPGGGSAAWEIEAPADALPALSEADLLALSQDPAGQETKGFVASGVLDVYVEPGLLVDIQSSLDVYVADLAAEGYSVTVQEFSGSAGDLRAQLQTRYSSSLLEGALLVGDLPTLTFRNDHDFDDKTVEFLHDLYFMDLDGAYILNDGSQPDEHLNGTGDVEPEIYVSRINTAPVTGLTGLSESALINDYFARVHDYRTGALTYQDKGIVWSDDDWQWSGSSMAGLYDSGDILNVQDPAETTRDSYLDSLSLPYESILEMIHSSVTYHSIDGTGGGNVNYNDLHALNPRVGFYNMWNCSSAKFTSSNNLISTYMYAGDYGLNAIGSTKTGSMLSPSSFYSNQGNGDSVGQAFAKWFGTYARETTTDGTSSTYVNWHYGMTMQGDPTLRPGVMGDAPPRVLSHSPEGAVTGQQGQVTFVFNEEMDGGSFDPAFDVVSFVGPGGVDLSSSILGHSWSDAQTLTVSFEAQGAPGDYALTVGPDIWDLTGMAMDQDADGKVGEETEDTYQASFTIGNAAPTVTMVRPATETANLADAGSLLVLDAEVADDGLGSGLTTAWTVESQPAGESVDIENPSMVDTYASFTGPGTYVLRLTADDGEHATSEDVTVRIGLASAGVYEEAGGTLAIEAEGFTGEQSGSGAAVDSQWQEATDSRGASGGLFVQAQPNAGVNVGDSTAGPRLAYAIDFQTAGTYYVWVRTRAADGNDDSFHAGLDGQPATYGGLGMGDSSGNWVWVDSAADGRVTVTVDQPGEHAFHLWMREDGVAVDKILLTTDSGYVPTGLDREAEPLVENIGPQTEAGGAWTSGLSAELNGSASDDGLGAWGGQLTLSWTQVAGPASSEFIDPFAEDTAVTSGQPGLYTFRFQADDGEIATAGDVTVPITLPGDATLDGTVDVGDLGVLAAHFNLPGAMGWTEGDFNADGVVDVGDLGVLAGRYGQQISPPPAPAGDEALTAPSVQRPLGKAGWTARALDADWSVAEARPVNVSPIRPSLGRPGGPGPGLWFGRSIRPRPVEGAPVEVADVFDLTLPLRLPV
jgi:hypothetical protein